MRRAVCAVAGLLSGCVAAPGAGPVSVAPPAPAPAPAVAAEIAIEGLPQQGGLVRGRIPPGASVLRLCAQTVPVSSDGSFILGFDRDAPATLPLTFQLPNGSVVTRTLAIAPRNWAIERVNVPKRPSVTNEEFERLRAPEVARINAARAVNAVSDGWRQRFAWPALGRISGVFGSQRIYRGGEPGAYHSGVDVAGGAGAPVKAPADGVVVLAAQKPFTLEGNLLIIDHGMGLNSAFLHLSRLDVREGDRVRQGQPVGAIGSTGRATGPHLHWAIKWASARIDPMALLPSPSTGEGDSARQR